MDISIFDNTIRDVLKKRLTELESHFESDIIFFYGEIFPSIVSPFRDFIEELKDENNQVCKLTIMLNTPGGSVETVEKLVDIVRYHYKEIYFIVPDYAMSSGTIFCMSGNKIYMDYTSSLGPIDPQVQNSAGLWVPALGYLDKVEELIEKAKKNELTHPEFLVFQSFDYAFLNKIEQAKNLTITLLKNWLVKYKFADWTKHRTNQEKKDKAVTSEEKEKRAKEIAEKLSDNKLWHSHGRFIGIEKIKSELKLEVEDYSNNLELRKKIRAYNDCIVGYIQSQRLNGLKENLFLHSKKTYL